MTKKEYTYATLTISESIAYVPEGAFILLNGWISHKDEIGNSIEPKFEYAETPVYAIKTVLENKYSKSGKTLNKYFGSHQEYLDAGFNFEAQEPKIVAMTVEDDEFGDFSFYEDDDILVPRSHFEANKERILACLRARVEIAYKHQKEKKP